MNEGVVTEVVQVRTLAQEAGVIEQGVTARILIVAVDATKGIDAYI